MRNEEMGSRAILYGAYIANCHIVSIVRTKWGYF